ncbi:hypothetical protein BOX15_Mlig009922g1 [Macrostomum lignano]|uniref:Protein kinase C n=1 Tax=Macrostomum lignano TaxID=282301 RepID=A0A267G858_9PLAT|nr:hypothetical protein BOX15_Mlig009922g1 [Macrostomum lignano]
MSYSYNGTNSVDSTDSVRVKVVFGDRIFVSQLPPTMSYAELSEFVANMLDLYESQPFTIKWLDEEKDPCTLTSDMETHEAFRLYHANKENELLLHVFASVPARPGMPCQGETSELYRKGAMRRKKNYVFMGHKFQPKRFKTQMVCALCNSTIWGLGAGGVKCTQCRMLVHKRCYRYANHQCGQLPPQPRPATGGSLRGQAGEQPGNSAAKPQPPAVVNDSTNEYKVEPVAPPSRQSQQKSRDPLADFALLRVIGRGSYAKVLQVEHKQTRRIYAMKVIKKELVTDEEDIEWVQTEKHVFEQATNHPFLVGLHSCFQTDSRLFFVIEFVNGGDLMFHMQRYRKLSEDSARFYAAEISCALHFLHQKGIIYRDLKLDNVLLDSEGHIKLTDYGMCKEGISATNLASTFCGTPNYIAPEILTGDPYGFSVDYWALGVLMYEMMVGKSPWDLSAQGNNTEDALFQLILSKTLRMPRTLTRRASSVLEGFLEKNPSKRLGCKSVEDFVSIKDHAFFRCLPSWEKLEDRQLPPPYRPEIRDEKDLSHFDTLFTNEPVQFTPDNPTVIARIDQTEFDGFEYVNPLIMTKEDSV